MKWFLMLLIFIAGVYYLVAGAGVVFGIIMSAIGFFFAHFGLSR